MNDSVLYLYHLDSPVGFLLLEFAGSLNEALCELTQSFLHRA